MITDALTRLSGTSGTTAAPQDLDPAAAATPLLSTHWMDLSDKFNSNRLNGNKADTCLHAVFSFANESLAASNALATINFQLITTPRTVATGQTFTADATTDLCTIAAGGDILPAGSLVTVSSGGTLPTGLAASTHYYVVSPAIASSGAQTFRLATTPDGTNRAGGSTLINITGAGSGTHTVTHVPQVIADSGPVPLARCRISDAPTGASIASGGQTADQIVITTNPLPYSPVPPLHRYLFARYVVSHDLTAGMAYCDVGRGVPGNNRLYHASGFTIL